MIKKLLRKIEDFWFFNVKYKEIDTSNWPSDVKPITWGQLSLLGIDNNGYLYYDGKQIRFD